MAIDDFLVSDAPHSVYLFPTPTTALDFDNPPSQSGVDNPLYFQYWPQSLQDNYEVEYAEHAIPGGSHPLYQWVGGRGRTLSFEAIFTAEINESRAGSKAFDNAHVLAQSLTPSSVYTVNIVAALAKLRAWMMPRYERGARLGETNPPKILTLVFPKTKLGGSGGALSDAVTVILRNAPITYEAWFPNGEPRVATVQLTFNEIVQTPSGSGQNKTTQVQFISREGFEQAGKKYRNRGLPDRPWFGG